MLTITTCLQEIEKKSLVKVKTKIEWKLELWISQEHYDTFCLCFFYLTQ